MFVSDFVTNGQTDAEQSDPYVPLCFAGDTKKMKSRPTDPIVFQIIRRPETNIFFILA